MQLGYVRVSTSAQDLARQYAALREHGIADESIWSDKKTGANTDRPGLAALLAYARSGDVLVTHTLDQLGRNLRDCLNLVHELRERGVGIKTLAAPLAIDTADTSAMGQVAVAMLSLFSEIERVFARERAAHARTVRAASGTQVGRRKVLTGEARDAALAAVGSGTLGSGADATHARAAIKQLHRDGRVDHDGTGTYFYRDQMLRPVTRQGPALAG